MKFGAAPRRKALINITSLIDVVFLLLLFYVVTSTFLERSGLELTLPAASASGVARRDEVTLELDERGGTWLDGRPVDAAGLERALQEAMAAGGTERVVLEADERVSQGRQLLKEFKDNLSSFVAESAKRSRRVIGFSPS